MKEATMTLENPLALDVATRTTRGRACPRCGGKIIPSDRAVYQSTGDPDALFPVWQCERCGYEEMSALPKTAVKAKADPAKLKTAASASPALVQNVKKPLPPALLDPQGRPYPADVAQLLERLKVPGRKDA